jgi:hypothetical protein
VEKGEMTETAKIIMVYQTGQIIGRAFLEGAGFFGCIAYLLEENLIGLSVVGGSIFLQLASFPTRAKITQWVESQKMVLEELRQRGG